MYTGAHFEICHFSSGKAGKKRAGNILLLLPPLPPKA